MEIQNVSIEVRGKIARSRYFENDDDAILIMQTQEKEEIRDYCSHTTVPNENFSV